METMCLSYVPSQEPSRISVAACTNNLWKLSWKAITKGEVGYFRAEFQWVGWLLCVWGFTFLHKLHLSLLGGAKKLLEVFPMSTWDMTSNLWEQNTLGGRGHNPKFAKRTDWFFYKTTQKYIPAEVFTKRFWSSISFGICFSMSVEMRNTPGLQVSMSQNSNFFGKWFYDLSSKFPQRILLKFKTVPWNMLLEEHIRMLFMRGTWVIIGICTKKQRPQVLGSMLQREKTSHESIMISSMISQIDWMSLLNMSRNRLKLNPWFRHMLSTFFKKGVV